MQDIHAHTELAFPTSLPQFQKLFPDDAACGAYLERIRWEHGFCCPHCGERKEPFRFANRPAVLRCRACRRDIALTAGTVMERTHTPLSVWFWGAYLTASHTAGMSATQFQRQLGLKRYATAHEIHRLLKRISLKIVGKWSIKKALNLEEPEIMKRGPKPQPIKARFFKYVAMHGPVPEHRPELGPCHVWTGTRRPDGYGIVTVEAKGELAHRMAFYIAEGRWPDPCALHHCDNRACVRRSHLFEGTKKDNTADMVAKKRGTPSKLSEAQMREIIALRASGVRGASIATRFGISQSLVSFIVNHRATA